MGALDDSQYINLLPGDISHAGTDESTYADLLLQETVSDGDEKSTVQLDTRIKIKEQCLKSLRLQIAKPPSLSDIMKPRSDSFNCLNTILARVGVPKDFMGLLAHRSRAILHSLKTVHEVA